MKGTIPAFTNISVGSDSGTTGALFTLWWPRASKKRRKFSRISVAGRNIPGLPNPLKAESRENIPERSRCCPVDQPQLGSSGRSEEMKARKTLRSRGWAKAGELRDPDPFPRPRIRSVRRSSLLHPRHPPQPRKRNSRPDLPRPLRPHPLCPFRRNPPNSNRRWRRSRESAGRNRRDS